MIRNELTPNSIKSPIPSASSSTTNLNSILSPQNSPQPTNHNTTNGGSGDTLANNKSSSTQQQQSSSAYSNKQLANTSTKSSSSSSTKKSLPVEKKIKKELTTSSSSSSSGNGSGSDEEYNEASLKRKVVTQKAHQPAQQQHESTKTMANVNNVKQKKPPTIKSEPQQPQEMNNRIISSPLSHLPQQESKSDQLRPNTPVETTSIRNTNGIFTSDASSSNNKSLTNVSKNV